MVNDDPGVEALIEMARTNPQCLGELLERYRSFLWLMAQREIPSGRAGECDVSGIVQNTMLEACQGFERFDGASELAFSAWLKRIHHHNILDRVRRVRPEFQMPADPEATASIHWWEPSADQTSPSQRVVQGERALRLAESLQSLPEAQREAVRLRHFEGWPVDKIAAHLNRTVVATAGLLKRGLQGLRERMSGDSRK